MDPSIVRSVVFLLLCLTLGGHFVNVYMFPIPIDKITSPGQQQTNGAHVQANEVAIAPVMTAQKGTSLLHRLTRGWGVGAVEAFNAMPFESALFPEDLGIKTNYSIH